MVRNSTAPAINTMTKAANVQGAVSRSNWGTDFRGNPIPRRLKSTAAIVPMETPNPTMWNISVVGKTHSALLSAAATEFACKNSIPSTPSSVQVADCATARRVYHGRRERGSQQRTTKNNKEQDKVT